MTTAPWTKKDRAKIASASRRPTSVSAMRYLPNDRRISVTIDAATYIPSGNNTDLPKVASDDALAARALMAHQHQDGQQGSPLSSSPLKNNESSSVAPFPFDMELAAGIKIQTGLEKNNLLSSPSVVIGSDASGGAIDMNKSSISMQGAPRVMNRIRPEKVPCPRLCGASFGINGLVCFRNGQVQKMWAWFQSTDPKRRNNNNNPSNIRSGNSNLQQENHHQQQQPGVVAARTYPRTKKDLNDMNKAAKEAQWGETAQDSPSETSKNDESEESTIDDYDIFSSDGDDDELMDDDYDNFDGSQMSLMLDRDDENEDKGDGLYEKYFGSETPNPLEVKKKGSPSSQDRQRSPAGINEEKHEILERREERTPSFEGPSSDLLAPVVCLNFGTSELAFDGQTIYLAEHLQLGDWNADTLMDVFDDEATQATSSTATGSSHLPSLIFDAEEVGRARSPGRSGKFDRQESILFSAYLNRHVRPQRATDPSSQGYHHQKWKHHHRGTVL